MEAKENAQAMKEADPGVVDDLKAADRESGPEGGSDGSADYKPSKDTPEGVDLEPVDDEEIKV